MWENLVDLLPSGRPLDEDRWAELATRVTAADVDDACLSWIERELRSVLETDVRLRVIPFGCDRREQLGIVSAIADGVSADDRLVLDITHAFRHLPVIASSALAYVARARRASVESIYSGAFEMASGGAAPVRVRDTADPSALSDLGGLDSGLRKALQDAGFARKIGQLGRMVDRLSAARGALRNRLETATTRDDPLLQLVGDDVDQVLSPTGQRHTWTAMLRFAEGLAECDPMRALVLLREAVDVWADEVHFGGKLKWTRPEDRRRKIREKLPEAHRDGFNLLCDFRNRVVHGRKPGQKMRRDEIGDAMKTPEGFGHLMRRVLEETERMIGT